jgi:hypothetical protein
MITKQPSGRSGRRRHTIAEARLAGPKALAAHRRLYGEPPPSGAPLALDPPAWLPPVLRPIWDEVITVAPPGVLGAIDQTALVSYVATIFEQRRFVARLSRRKTPPTGALLRQFRLLAIELRDAGRHLGFSLAERTKLAAPIAPAEGLDNPFMRFDTILPDGRRIPYAETRGKRFKI